MRITLSSTVLVLGCGLALGCSTPAPPVDAAYADAWVPPDANLGSPAIVLRGGGSLVAVAGDVLHLEVAMVSSTGDRTTLPTGSVVEWTLPATLIALASGSTPASSQLPATGNAPVGFFLQNREHYTDAELDGVLFVIDAGAVPGGMLAVDAHITGDGLDARVSASIPVGPVPGGDAARGAIYYMANCASCHGSNGQGGSASGINHAGGNVASDPAWNAALFSSVMRGSIDELGVAGAPNMPAWLTDPTPSGAPLRTQDLVDVYGWLLTQN